MYLIYFFLFYFIVFLGHASAESLVVLENTKKKIKCKGFLTWVFLLVLISLYFMYCSIH